MFGAHWALPEQEQIITVDGSKQKSFDKEYIFTMRDPFDNLHNPGRMKASETNTAMQKFRDAY